MCVKVTVAEIRAHAAHVDEVTDALNEAHNAAATTEQSAEAYGIFARPIVPVFNRCIQGGAEVLETAGIGSNHVARALRETAAIYEHTEERNRASIDRAYERHRSTAGDGGLTEHAAPRGRRGGVFTGLDSVENATKGLPIAEDILAIVERIEDGHWARFSLDTVVDVGAIGKDYLKTQLDALAIALDPVGSAVEYVFGWLLYHLEPLQKALDELVTRPEEIQAKADTWQNIAQEIIEYALGYGRQVEADLRDWSGKAKDNYQASARRLGQVHSAVAGYSSGVYAAMTLFAKAVDAVRGFVIAHIARLMSTLTVRVPEWALEAETIALIPVAVADIADTVARFLTPVLDLLDKLVTAYQELSPLLEQLRDAAGTLKETYRNVVELQEVPHYQG
ncbi:type VII secretion target [Sciscionella sediminilitoris]|uniref:type VII secretion target n=1 Tax=Sciscionella sediminilitoris TaxID=1445613 RepID=UPI0004DFBA56|nr:type VII secretion target [Sciscionella sp. SE31]